VAWFFVPLMQFKCTEMFNKKTIQEIADLLIKEQQKLAVAESVTSGLLQTAFAAAENASSFFEGGLTAYNLLQKWRLLQIDETHALRCNCVSPQVALEMARGIQKLFGTDWGIGITGYAAKVPEMGINQLFAHVAVVCKDKTILERTIFPPGDELLDVQVYYVNETAGSLLGSIKKATELVFSS
jgi:nicotinamide-nucleotide amidase